METVYRIFTWIIMGTSSLLLTALFSMGRLFLPDGLKWILYIVLPLFFILLMYSGWKRKIKKDTVVEPVQKSRLQTALTLIGIAQILFALLSVGIYHCRFNSFIRINIELSLLALLLISIVLTVIFLPFKKHVKGTEFASSGLIAGIIINLIAGALTPVIYDFYGDKLPKYYELSTTAQQRFFPEGAYNFEIRGHLMTFSDFIEWSCNVSEKDFEAFRKKNGYNFVQNRTDVNENSEVGPQNYLDFGWQKPYYFYNNRYSNGGGLTLRYSVPEQKLYGQYSTR